MIEANKGTRIINYLIDLILITMLYVIVFIILNSKNEIGIFYIVYLLYYFLFEHFKGQTIGKMITNTIVVDKHDLKPSLKRILLRTILRLNPFDGFSYLTGLNRGGHDLMSKTKLVILKKK